MPGTLDAPLNNIVERWPGVPVSQVLPARRAQWFRDHLSVQASLTPCEPDPVWDRSRSTISEDEFIDGLRKRRFQSGARVDERLRCHPSRLGDRPRIRLRFLRTPGLRP